VSTFDDCIDSSFIKLYAIARRNSYVAAPQFVRFCKEIEAPLTPARWQYERLFSRNLIDSVFEVEEYAFDAIKLRNRLLQAIEDSHVELQLNATVEAVSTDKDDNNIQSIAYRQANQSHHVKARAVFDCTYAGLNELKSCQIPLKFEIAEMALVKVPDELKNLGITVMDGPFFSVMPFPSRQLHSLSHVRYTPRMSWTGDETIDREAELKKAKETSFAQYMLRDAAKFLPSLGEAIIEDSMFEIKALLVKNELDDGRPILFNKPDPKAQYYCILGGKIDNIFDIYEKLKTIDLEALAWN
jgi:glycine/D-amino acid oxidase-like deaminating enzyme